MRVVVAPASRASAITSRSLGPIGANAAWGEVRIASSTARSTSRPLSPPGSATSTRSVTSSATPASLEAAMAAAYTGGSAMSTR